MNPVSHDLLKSVYNLQIGLLGLLTCQQPLKGVYMFSLISRCALVLSLSSVLIIAYAADVPQDDMGSTNLHNLECVDENTQRCINDECLTSDATDCQDKCKQMAQETCQQQSNE